MAKREIRAVLGLLDRVVGLAYHKITNTTAFSVRRDGSFSCL